MRHGGFPGQASALLSAAALLQPLPRISKTLATPGTRAAADGITRADVQFPRTPVENTLDRLPPCAEGPSLSADLVTIYDPYRAWMAIPE